MWWDGKKWEGTSKERRIKKQQIGQVQLRESTKRIWKLLPHLSALLPLHTIFPLSSTPLYFLRDPLPSSLENPFAHHSKTHWESHTANPHLLHRFSPSTITKLFTSQPRYHQLIKTPAPVHSSPQKPSNRDINGNNNPKKGQKNKANVTGSVEFMQSDWFLL